MGIFKRRQETVIPARSASGTITVSESDLEQARRLLHQMEHAIAAGSDLGLRQAAAEISIASGVPDYQYLVLNLDEHDRTWRWLQAVARRAGEIDDALLVAHVWLFLMFWSSSMEPRLTAMAGQMDMIGLGMVRVSPGIKKSVAAIAQDKLGMLAPDLKVAGDENAAITVQGLLELARAELRT